MREHRITLPELALIAGTRGMMGLGAGLLMSRRLRRAQRRAVGFALLLAGALSTIPLGILFFRGGRTRDVRARDVRARAESLGVEPHRTETAAELMAD